MNFGRQAECENVFSLGLLFASSVVLCIVVSMCLKIIGPDLA